MSIQSQIIKMVAEGVDNAVPAVSKVLREAPDSARKALDEIADDWGWKGGKPGEISGTDFMNELERIGRMRGGIDAKSLAHSKLQDRAISQLDAAAAKGKFPQDWEDVDSTMSEFARLERLGVPRSLTGKFMNTLGGWIPSGVQDRALVDAAKLVRGYLPGQVPVDLGDALRTHLRMVGDGASGQLNSALVRELSDAQKETLLKLLPEWSGSLEDLAKAARSL